MQSEKVTQVQHLVIGAGMSGLACALRLGQYQSDVLIVERHSITGGLNSYYERRHPLNKAEKIKFDVGLHALTNYSSAKNRKTALNKLFRQLKIKRSSLPLIEQKKSLISFGESKKKTILEFTNNIEVLEKEVQTKFPQESENFKKLIEDVLDFDEVNLTQDEVYTRDYLNNLFKDQLLIEMILMPVLIYGSSWENDILFPQFVIMFKALYLEGFSRPKNGVREILDLLEKEVEESSNVRMQLRSKVDRFIIEGDKILGVILGNGEKILAQKIYSSAGLIETGKFLPLKAEIIDKAHEFQGNMSFVEVIFVLKNKMDHEFPYSIIFHNKTDHYDYQMPKDAFDESSAVVCFPDNFQEPDDSNYSQVRVTMIANYDEFKQAKILGREQYNKIKSLFTEKAFKLIQDYYPIRDEEVLMVDAFTPLTVEKYTSHTQGCVYGSTKKLRDGRTDYSNLYLIGTDQGFLGIVGAMLSGISMANYHGLVGD